MEDYLRTLFIDANTTYYKVQKFKIGDFFGPVDLGLHLSKKYNSLNIGTGLLSGSIFPGSNRLVFTGNSPAWEGFYISSMGGAGLVFDNLGINMLSIINKASTPSVLYLNRIHGEEIQVEILPIDINKVWSEGRGGIYSIMDFVYDKFKDKYITDPRILAVGQAALFTDFGGIASAPIQKSKITYVDTWAGRGGFGTKMLKEHGIAAVIYGGTFLDEDFRDRKVADKWFEDKFNKKMAAKDFEATTKYRFDPNFETGGTFGVNYSTLKGAIIAFNYKSIYMTEEERLKIHKEFIVDHYLKQFNEETIIPKQYKNCGEPCAAMCKKMNGEYKKDYEPYQTMGPLLGVFDQRAAEKVAHKADLYGFDAISVGGVLSWLAECLDEGLVTKEELGVTTQPKFTPDNFDVVNDSLNNAKLGMELLDSIIQKRGIINLERGARKFARQLARDKGKEVLDKFVFVGFGRNGWVVPNQYWTPAALSPMPIMGKYYMYYGQDFFPPRELGEEDVKHLKSELALDNLGICRFHRKWASKIMPDIVESIYGLKDKFLENNKLTAIRISSRNESSYWISERNADFIYTFLKRKKEITNNPDKELLKWVELFEKDKKEAAFSFWNEMYKGIVDSTQEFDKEL